MEAVESSVLRLLMSDAGDLGRVVPNLSTQLFPLGLNVDVPVGLHVIMLKRGRYIGALAFLYSTSDYCKPLISAARQVPKQCTPLS